MFIQAVYKNVWMEYIYSRTKHRSRVVAELFRLWIYSLSRLVGEEFRSLYIYIYIYTQTHSMIDLNPVRHISSTPHLQLLLHETNSIYKYKNRGFGISQK